MYASISDYALICFFCMKMSITIVFCRFFQGFLGKSTHNGKQAKP
jgi:hypothetical protein